MIPLIKGLLLSFIIMAAVRSGDIENLCQPITHRMVLASTGTKVDFDPKAYSKNDILGNGSFGLVYQSTLPVPKDASGAFELVDVAVKRVLFDKIRFAELDLMQTMGELGIGPTFYGCQYGYANTEVEAIDAYGKKIKVWKNLNFIWVVQDMLYKDLDSSTAKSFLQVLSLDQKIVLYSNVVRGLFLLNARGYIHSDLKPGNLMINDKLNRIYTIDYGVAQLMNSGRFITAGTPYFLNINKHIGPKHLTRDDLYAFALTIAVTESSYDDVFHSKVTEYRDPITNEIKKKYIKLDDSCFLKYLTETCWSKIFSNCQKIFESRQFGLYQKDEKDPFKWNFTTLLLSMIDQTTGKLYPHSMLDTFHFMDNIIINMRVYRRLIKNFEGRQLSPPSQNEFLNMVENYVEFSRIPFDNKIVERKNLANIKPSLIGYNYPEELMQNAVEKLIARMNKPAEPSASLPRKPKIVDSSEKSSNESVKNEKKELQKNIKVQDNQKQLKPEVQIPISPKIDIKHPVNLPKSDNLAKKPNPFSVKKDPPVERNINLYGVELPPVKESRSLSKNKEKKEKVNFIQKNILEAKKKPHEKIAGRKYKQDALVNKKIEEIQNKDQLAKIRGKKLVPVQDYENVLRQQKLDLRIEQIIDEMNIENEAECTKKLDELWEEKNRIDKAPLLESEILQEHPEFLQAIRPENLDNADENELANHLPDINQNIEPTENDNRVQLDFKQNRSDRESKFIKFPPVQQVPKLITYQNQLRKKSEQEEKGAVEAFKNIGDDFRVVLNRPHAIEKLLAKREDTRTQKRPLSSKEVGSRDGQVSKLPKLPSKWLLKDYI